MLKQTTSWFEVMIVIWHVSHEALQKWPNAQKSKIYCKKDITVRICKWVLIKIWERDTSCMGIHSWLERREKWLKIVITGESEAHRVANEEIIWLDERPSDWMMEERCLLSELEFRLIQGWLILLYEMTFICQYSAMTPQTTFDFKKGVILNCLFLHCAMCLCTPWVKYFSLLTARR